MDKVWETQSKFTSFGIIAQGNIILDEDINRSTHFWLLPDLDIIFGTQIDF